MELIKPMNDRTSSIIYIEFFDLYRKANVHFGAHDICEEDWVSTQLVRPSRFKIHPGYNPKTDDNDVAILLLKRDINFGPKVV